MSISLIAETAWHHQGDYEFMSDLVTELCERSFADVIKFHVTLDLDEYIDRDHQLYATLKSWTLTEQQWADLVDVVRRHQRQLMLLVNDSVAIEFSSQVQPEFVELHSACVNNLFLLEALSEKSEKFNDFVLGVGGTQLEEIDYAASFLPREKTVLMFGFQNHPTSYESVNLKKIRRVMRAFAGSRFGYADHTSWDHDNNELVTLIVAANEMDYVEKHVTIDPGGNRVDSTAAISIEMFNSLAQTLKVLEALEGNGLLELNDAERNYSTYGPMKMAAIATSDLQAGTVFDREHILFRRTSRESNMSQYEVVKRFGQTLSRDVEKGSVIISELFA